MKKILWLLAGLTVYESRCQQILKLDSIFSAIRTSNALLKGYDAQIRSLDEAAKGARAWEAPLISTGFWMTPYDPNLWKQQVNGSSGMGQYMISAQQMFPNHKKLDADEKYMQAMSSVEKEKKNVSLNELYASAKQNYYQWIVLKRKLTVLYQDSLLLEFMVKNAELRYRNNLGKIRKTTDDSMATYDVYAFKHVELYNVGSGKRRLVWLILIYPCNYKK